MAKKLFSLITAVLLLILSLSIVSASTSYYNWRYTGNNEPDTSSFVSKHFGSSSASSSSSTSYSNTNSKSNSNTMFGGSFNNYNQAKKQYESQPRSSDSSYYLNGPFQGGSYYPMSYYNSGYGGYGYQGYSYPSSGYYGGYDSYYGSFNGGYGSYFGSYW